MCPYLKCVSLCVCVCMCSRLEELDCRAREYSRKHRKEGGGGSEVVVAPESSSKSPRGSPVALLPVTQQISANPSPVEPLSRSPGETTPSSSGPATPSFNGTSSANHLVPDPFPKRPVEVLHQPVILRSRKLMHRRNSSDGGGVMGRALGGGSSSKTNLKVKEISKKHQRNMSDSITAASAKNTMDEVSSGRPEGRVSNWHIERNNSNRVFFIKREKYYWRAGGHCL